VAAKHYDETQLGGLLIEIGKINVWNRLNDLASPRRTDVTDGAGSTPHLD
jgi:hypothetical protein